MHVNIENLLQWTKIILNLEQVTYLWNGHFKEFVLTYSNISQNQSRPLVSDAK